MIDMQRSEHSSILVQISSTAVGVVILSVAWYFLVGLFGSTFSSAVRAVQLGGPVVFTFLVILHAAIEYLGVAKARAASKQVTEELKKFQGSSAETLSAVSAQDLELKDVKVASDQLARLVEQGKQQLLVDDEYFRGELGSLIVDYLQPLPRYAKRVFNRFRVNILIAHRRGLFTTEPKVSGQQLGKWLVLSERWPQLARALLAVPERIQELESALDLASTATPTDTYLATMKLLAPAYAEDPDLRRFIKSEPPLATVLARLVHYGAISTR